MHASWKDSDDVLFQQLKPRDPEIKHPHRRFAGVCFGPPSHDAGAVPALYKQLIGAADRNCARVVRGCSSGHVPASCLYNWREPLCRHWLGRYLTQSVMSVSH